MPCIFPLHAECALIGLRVQQFQRLTQRHLASADAQGALEFLARIGGSCFLPVANALPAAGADGAFVADVASELTALHPSRNVLSVPLAHNHTTATLIREAVRLNPTLRFQARNDPDFQNLVEDPRFTELLYPDPGAELPPGVSPSEE